VVVVWFGLPRLGRWFFRREKTGGISEYLFVFTALFAGAYLAEVAVPNRRLSMPGSCTATHLSGLQMEIPRRSWHLFEMVSLDGCPGFKGPDPQPVSMSNLAMVGMGGSWRQGNPGKGCTGRGFVFVENSKGDFALY
jgi:hypothetical protein